MQLRQTNIQRLKSDTFDVLVVGGGINGAVSAAALSGKGARVALIDQRDFAGFTSQHASNLAWGGIKYLESYDFGLVRKLCMSRNQLIRSYPSTVQEIRFLTTIQKGFRHPLLFLWAGTWLYWFFGNCFTRIPRLVPKSRMRSEESIIATDNVAGSFEYSDAYLRDNDSRFVFNFVRTAMNRGCTAANYVESLGGRRDGDEWVVQARDTVGGEEFEIHARVLINAAGPFVDDHNRLTKQKTAHKHVFSKGIHLIVDQLTPNRRVLAFFADDGRLFFVIPMGPSTCIGTTDTPVDSPHVEVTDEDVEFVLSNINKRLRLARPLERKDVIGYRCGVRPLAVNQGQMGGRDFLQLSRKHAVDINREAAHISIFGGKLTDCINVGDEICDATRDLGVHLPHPDFQWYGEPPEKVREEFFHRAKRMDLDAMTPPTSTEPLSIRLWRRYAEHATELLETIRENPKKAELLIEGTEYIRCELEQAARREMITKLEDFLRRRSKIELVVRRETIRNSPGLLEACRILFGDEAEAKAAEYFDDHKEASAA